MGNYVSEGSLPTYSSFLVLGNIGLLFNSCKILNDGNDNINDYLSIDRTSPDISGALSNSWKILNNENYNIDDCSSIYQICLDISEALIYQICSDISEALSNNSLLLTNICSQLARVNKLLKNIRSRLLRVSKLLMNICSQLSRVNKLLMDIPSQLLRLKLLIWRLIFWDYFYSQQLISSNWMSLLHIVSMHMNPTHVCRIVAMRAMRNYMLKHDYINMVHNSTRKPSNQDSLILPMQAHPAHYVMLCGLLYGIHQITSYTHFLLSTIAMCHNSETEVNNRPVATNAMLVGGGKSHITYGMLRSYLLPNGPNSNIDDSTRYRFVSHMLYQNAIDAARQNSDLLVCRMPLGSIINHLTLGQAKSVAKSHGVFVAYKAPLATILNTLSSHFCSSHCYDNVFVLKPVLNVLYNAWRDGITKARHRKNKNKSYSCTKSTTSFKQTKVLQNKKYYKNKKACKFPPSPPNDKLLHKIITGFCNDTHPSQFEEVGCAVCGQLTLKKNIIPLKDIQCSLDPLKQQGVTSIERKSELQEQQEIEGPIIDYDCVGMCATCHKHLDKGNCPSMVLANSFWIGKVPSELTGLTFVEKNSHITSTP